MEAKKDLESLCKNCIRNKNRECAEYGMGALCGFAYAPN